MWKKSEIVKNRKFQILLVFELLLLCVAVIGLLRGNRTICSEASMVITMEGGAYLEETQEYYVDGSCGVSGEWLEAGGFSLTPGVYELKVGFTTTDNEINTMGIKASKAGFKSLLANEVSLYTGIHERSGQFYVTDWLGEEDKLHVFVGYNGTEPLTISSIEIIKTNAGSRILLFCVLFGSVLLNSLLMIYSYMGKYPVSLEWKLTHFGIPALALLASIPVLVDYIVIGADLIFHLLRIEFLADSLAHGIFPARIESQWLYGHGYASSIFYGDTFLLIPALLRLIGFPMVVAYGTFIFVVNLGTAICSYFSFKGMFRDKLVGMFGCMLYTLAPYRIYNIYNRSAVGEYTAMTFLPLVCYGFYALLTQDTEKKEYKKYWLILVAGFSGIIQSHVLSCEIAVVYCALLCLIAVKRVFRKQTFLQLVKAVLGTVLVNLWFLVPFLDMMSADVYRFSQNTGNYVQMRGILPANILYTMQNAGGNSRFHELGMLDTEPIGVGVAVLLSCIAYFLLRGANKKESREVDQTALTAFLIGLAAIVMSMCYFPWDTIQSWNDITGTLVPMIQFPTRLTTIACVCMTIVACAAAVWMLREKGIKKYLFFLAVGGLCVFFSMYQTNDTLEVKEGAMRLHTAEAMGHSGVLGAEYLPLGVELNFTYHDARASEQVTVLEFAKENLDTTTSVSVAKDAKEQWIELPMLYYKGYQAKDLDSGKQLPVCVGENGHVRVLLEGGYQGTVRTWYAGMWYWRVAEIVSAVTVLGMLSMICWCKMAGKNRKTCENNQ